jgi:hypothetical protein
MSMTLQQKLQDLQDLVKFYAKTKHPEIVKWPDDKLDLEASGILSEREDE